MANTSKEKIQSIEQELWGKHGNNGLKSEVKMLSKEIQDLQKNESKMRIDINNIGNSFREVRKTSRWILGILVGAGIFEGALKILGIMNG